MRSTVEYEQFKALVIKGILVYDVSIITLPILSKIEIWLNVY